MQGGKSWKGTGTIVRDQVSVAMIPSKTMTIIISIKVKPRWSLIEEVILCIRTSLFVNYPKP
jgi:hypothetical protein